MEMLFQDLHGRHIEEAGGSISVEEKKWLFLFIPCFQVGDFQPACLNVFLGISLHYC